MEREILFDILASLRRDARLGEGRTRCRIANAPINLAFLRSATLRLLKHCYPRVVCSI